MLTLKQGDTFSVDGLISDETGPMDLTGWTLASQARTATSKVVTSGTLVADLIVTLGDQTTDPGTFTLSVASTSAWPISRLVCDVRLVSGDDIRHTETFDIAVVPPVTR